MRQSIRRKKFDWRAPDSSPREGKRLHFPPRLRYDRDLCDFTRMREKKVQIVPIGAALKTFEIFGDGEHTRFCANVDFAG